jgi:hypothetical protein
MENGKVFDQRNTNRARIGGGYYKCSQKTLRCLVGVNASERQRESDAKRRTQLRENGCKTLHRASKIALGNGSESRCSASAPLVPVVKALVQIADVVRF